MTAFRTLVSLVLISVAVHAQTALKAAQTVNVRKGPGTGYAVVGTVPAGHRYVGLFRTGDWWKIYFNGSTGYTHAAYWTSLSGGSGLKINVAALNVRSGPGTGYSILGQVYAGQIYCRTSDPGVNGWYKIYWGGKTAYIYGAYASSVSFDDESAAKVGLDMNQPVGDDGSVGSNADPARIANTGARWVRVNFIGDYFAQYDSIVNGLLAKGLKIYMLVGAQATSDPGDLLRWESSPDPAAAEQWISDYAAKFVQVVDHFKDRVRVFETFNEPNDWAGGWTHKVHPYWMAKILQEVYLNTKHFNGHASDSAWQVRIISGPLFSFDGTTAADYLSDVYWYGRNVLAWDWTREQTGSYPLDGIGYHIYVAQDSSQLSEVEWRVKKHLDEIWGVVSAYEGAGTSKRLWISEIGWPSGSSEWFQAQALTRGMGVLKSDARVALACWFSLQDFPGGDWGLFRSDWSPKAAHAAFQAVAKP